MELTQIEDAVNDYREVVEKNHEETKTTLKKLEDDSYELSERIAEIELKEGRPHFHSDIKRYNLSGVLKYLVAKEDRGDDIISELQQSEEFTRKTGLSAKGVHVPFSALVTKDTQASGSGGNLVGEQHRPDLFVEFLRPVSAIAQARPRTIDVANQNISIPKKTATSTPYWFGADGADQITPSDPVFEAIKLDPKFVGALSKISYKMITQGLPQVIGVLLDDIRDSLGDGIDEAFLNSDGLGASPLGLLNQPSLNTVAVAAAGAPTWLEVTRMVSNIRARKVSGEFVYMIHPTVEALLRSTEKLPNGGMPILSDDNRIGGNRVVMTTHMPVDVILCGVFEHAMLANWGGIDLQQAPAGQTEFAQGTESIRGIAAVDFDVRHIEAFELLTL